MTQVPLYGNRLTKVRLTLWSILLSLAVAVVVVAPVQWVQMVAVAQVGILQLRLQ